MYCPECGTANGEAARFCGSCGTALAGASAPMPAAPMPAPPMPAAPAQVQSAPLSPAMSPNQAPAAAVARAGMGPGARVALGFGVAIVAWLIIQFAVVPALNGGAPLGQYKLDTVTVEENIEDTYAEKDLLADARCPSNMVGAPGDTFICAVELPLITKDATVTISSDGGFEWVVKAGLN